MFLIFELTQIIKINDNFINIHNLSGNSFHTVPRLLMFPLRSNHTNNLTKEAVIRHNSETTSNMSQIFFFGLIWLMKQKHI